MKTFTGIALLTLGFAAGMAAQAPTSIPAGTSVYVRTIEAIDSKTADVNRKYAASLSEPLMVSGMQVAPRGADVQLRVIEDRQAGAVSGRTSLVLQVAAISINGQMVLVDTGTSVKESGSQGSKTAKRGILGAALGAGIGAIAGGGKGAAIGAGAGGTAGVVSAAISGERVKVPSESRLLFSLNTDAQLPVAPNASKASTPGYMQDGPRNTEPVDPNRPVIRRRSAPPPDPAQSMPAQSMPAQSVGNTQQSVANTQSFEGWDVSLDHCEKRGTASVTCYFSFTNTLDSRDMSLRLESTAVDSDFNVLKANSVQLGQQNATSGATGMTMQPGTPVNGMIEFQGVAANIHSLGKLKVMIRWPKGNGTAEFSNVPLQEGSR